MSDELELEESNNIQRPQADYGYVYDPGLNQLTCSSCGLVIDNGDVMAMLDHIEAATYGAPLPYD